MQVKKKVVGISLITLIVALFLGGLVWIMREAQIAWDDNNTWKVDSSVALPVVAEGVFKMKQEQVDDSTTRITIPFCVLHKTVQRENDVTEYHCAAIPYSTLELVDFFPTSFHLKDDIVFTFNPEQDVLPDEFLGKIGINPVTLKSFGAEPVPITAEFEVTHEKPRKTPTAFFTHYRKTLAGETETYAQTSLTSWSVNNVRLAADYSEEERKQIITEWRKQAWEDVNALFTMDEVLKAPNNRELVGKMGEAMKYGTVYCPTTEVAEGCKLTYIQNPSTNIMFYTYAATVLDKGVAKKVSDAFRDQVIPFVFRHNQELASYYETCDPFSECPYFHHMQVYDYPVCPVNDLSGSSQDNQEVKKFFEDFRVPLVGNDFVDRPLDLEKIRKEYELLTDDFVKSGIKRRFVEWERGEGATAVDSTCQHLVYGIIKPDDRAIDLVRQMFFMYALGQVVIDEELFMEATGNLDEILFQLILNASVLNPYEHSLIPQPYKSYNRILTGVDKAEPSYLRDGYWASANMTLILLYLTNPR